MNLRVAAQQALEVLEWNYNTDLDNIPACEQWAKMLNETITALKQALAELDSDYERGFVDGMNLQTKRSVDKAVNRMAQTTHWEGCEAVHPECRKQEPDGISWLKRDSGYFTAPTPRKPLTDEEIGKIAGDCLDAWSCARAIERAHGIGEQT